MVAAMKPRARRAAYLDGIQKVRGQAARDRIARDLELLWGKRKSPISPDVAQGDDGSLFTEQGEQDAPGCGSSLAKPNQGNSNRDESVNSEGVA